MMQNTLIDRWYIKLLVVIVCTLVSFLFWVWVFNASSSKQISGGDYTDKLSRETVSIDSINSASNTNPDLPYFVGFNNVKQYGASDDDFDYIQDVLINYSLYDQKQIRAKISYVDGSFRSLPSQDMATNYSFNIGINDGNIRTVKVSSDIVTMRITITLLDGDVQVFNKTFDVYSE